MKYPKIVIKNKKKYELIKIYENYALYVNEAGIRECFNPSDLGLIEEKRKVNDIANHYLIYTN